MKSTVCIDSFPLKIEWHSAMLNRSGENSGVYVCVFAISFLIYCSYVVCVGLIDKLAEYFRSIIGPFDDMNVATLIISGLNTLMAFTAFLHFE